MRTSYKQLALEYQDRFCAAVADYKRENELRLFYEKENKQLKGKLKTVTDAADSTMCHMQYYEKQCKELEEENAELELKIKKLTQHLEPQAMTALFEQVEEEVNQEQKIKELETKVKEWQALQEMFEGKSFKLEGEIANIHKENAELKETIHKAEEIIKGLYFIIQGRIDYENNIGIADEMWRAKQFWKK